MLHIRDDVPSINLFAAAVVRGTTQVFSLDPPGESRANSFRVGVRLRASLRGALRRIGRAIRICLATARAPTSSVTARTEVQADTQTESRPAGSFLRRMD